ncbi:C40 family peptidase [Eoetvoesiella caeni]
MMLLQTTHAVAQRPGIIQRLAAAACRVVQLKFRQNIFQPFALIFLGMLLAGCASPGPQRNNAALQKIVIDPGQRTELVMTAMSLLNTRYRYGGSSPEEGFDCSGLVAYVVDSVANKRLPHNTASLAQISHPVHKDELEAGDLVFFNTLDKPNSHVGIYVGDGLFINAPSSGGRVRIDSLGSRYFAQRFDGARSFFSQ